MANILVSPSGFKYQTEVKGHITVLIYESRRMQIKTSEFGSTNVDVFIRAIQNEIHCDWCGSPCLSGVVKRSHSEYCSRSCSHNHYEMNHDNLFSDADSGL